MTRLVLPNRLAGLAQSKLAPPSAFEQLPQSRRDVATDREVLVKHIVEAADLRGAAELLAAQISHETAPIAFAPALARLGEVSATQLYRWALAYQKDGLLGLAPKYTGRVRKEYGWETRAVAMFQQPTKPAFATVAYWLRQEGYESATKSRVRRYLQSLPSNLTVTAPSRIGRHYYNQNVKPHKVRDASVLPVGFVYTADGHCFKAFFEHPSDGTAWRPELTAWLDVKSHKCVSWWLSEAESAETTLFSLSQALIGQDHVPAFVHCDPGSGFKARLISDDVVGFLSRFHIEPIFSLPGNARGKGLIEGFWRWLKERLAKRFDTYCGGDRTDDALSRMQTKIRRGEIRLPTFQELLDELRAFITWYNAQPQESLANRSPNQVWEALERVGVETPAAAVIRPREIRTVTRWTLRLHGRSYRHADLAAYEGTDLVCEYSLHDDNRIWVHDQDGRFICEAPLLEKQPWLPESRIEEGKQRRLEGQKKRLEAKVAQAEARARAPVAATAAIAITDAPAPAESLERLQGELAAEASAVDDDTPESRFTRALALERTAAPLSADDTRWLAIYQESAEYHSRRRLMEFSQEADASDPTTTHPGG